MSRSGQQGGFGAAGMSGRDEQVGGSPARRFAAFAALIFLAHLALPWFADSGPGGRVRPRFWWNLMLDHSLPEPVLFQVFWMGVSLVCLGLAFAAGPYRRGFLLVVVGTTGLLMSGWGAFVKWVGARSVVADLSQVFVLAAVGMLLVTALESAQLRAVLAGAWDRASRRAAAFLGGLSLLLAVAAAALLPAAGRQVSLIDPLVPGGSSAGHLVLAGCFLVVLALVAAAGLASVGIVLAPERWRLRAARAAHVLLRLAILVTPIATVALTGGESRASGHAVGPAPFLEARLVAIHALDWFALSIGGQVVLSGREADQAEEGF